MLTQVRKGVIWTVGLGNNGDIPEFCIIAHIDLVSLLADRMMNDWDGRKAWISAVAGFDLEREKGVLLVGAGTMRYCKNIDLSD